MSNYLKLLGGSFWGVLCVFAFCCAVRAQSAGIQVDSLKTFKFSGRAQFLLFHPSKGLIAAGSSRGVTVFNLDDSSSWEIPTCERRQLIAGAESRDGSRIAVVCDDGSIILTQWESRLPATFIGKAHNKEIKCINFSPSGTELISAGEDKQVVAWDITGKRELIRFNSTAKKPFVFAGYSSMGGSVVALTEDGRLIEWDSRTGKTLRDMAVTDGLILGADISTSGNLLAIGSEMTQPNKAVMGLSGGGRIGNGSTPNPATDLYCEDRLIFFDLTKGAIVKSIDGLAGQLRGLNFSADNRYVIAARQGSSRTYLSVYDIMRGPEVFSRETLNKSVLARFSPDGRFLSGLTSQGDLSVFKVAGIQPSVAIDDLVGTKIRSTSPSQLPLVKADMKLALAIMDLESLGAAKDRDIGKSVSEMIRNRIAGDNITIIAADRIQEIIKQQVFQQSNLSDIATAVKIGGIVGANKIIIGSVSVLGSQYTVTVRLVDVATAVEGTRAALCQGCTDEDLQEVVSFLAPMLVEQRR